MAMPRLDAPLLRGPFTVDDFYRMGELGLLKDDGRYELLDGQVVEMSPIGARHAACVNRLTMLLARRVPDRIIVSVQNPVIAELRSVPQPDVTVLRSSSPDALPAPGDVLLLIEVADSSLRRDRDVKLPIYSRNGVPEVWIVDLRRGTVIVHTEPSPGGYGAVRTVHGEAVLTPAGLHGVSIEVREILG